MALFTNKYRFKLETTSSMVKSLVLVLITAPFLSFAQSWSGKAVHITDGDTYVVRKAPGKKVDVRLYGIDAPETGQPYGHKATKAARQKLLNSNIRVKPIEKGPYGRLISIVYSGQTCLNRWLLNKGLAWYSGKYCKRSICESWQNIEQQQRAQNTGLWSQADPTPPWQFR